MSTLPKRRIRPSAIFILPLFALLATACLSPAGDKPSAKKADPEQTQGQVRVILLRVGRHLSTNGQPEFVVTYGIEVPLRGAFSDLHFSGNNEITLLDHGQPVDFPDGFMSGSSGLKDLPRQNELTQPITPAERALLTEEIVFPKLTIHSRKLDVRVQFAWRGTPMRFDFKDVPVSLLGV